MNVSVSPHPLAAHESRGLKLLMLSGAIPIALTFTAISSVLPQIESELAHSATDRLLIKMLFSIVGISMVIGAPIAGFLTDRFGVKRVFLPASLLFSLAGTAGLYVVDLDILLATRLLVGGTAATMAATSMTIINRQLNGTERAKLMGAHVAITTIASVILHPLAGALGEISWRYPFALYGLGLFWTALIFFSPQSQELTAVPGERPASPKAPFLSWFPIRYAVLALCIGSVTYLPLVYVPFLLHQAGVTSPLIISLVALADTVMAAGFAFFFERARRKYSHAKLFIYSFGCTGAGLWVAGISGSFSGIVIGMCLFGLGLGWFVPNLMTAAAGHVTFHQQGRTVGMVKGAHYLAAPLCILLAEPITSYFGPASAMLMAAAGATALGLFFAIRLGRGVPDAKPVEAA